MKRKKCDGEAKVVFKDCSFYFTFGGASDEEPVKVGISTIGKIDNEQLVDSIRQAFDKIGFVGTDHD